MKNAKWYIILLFGIILFSTTPTYDQHRDKLISVVTKDNFGTDKGFLGTIAKAITNLSLDINDVIDSEYYVEDYYLFSIGYFKNGIVKYDSGNEVDAPDSPSTFGILGWVWVIGADSSRLD